MTTTIIRLSDRYCNKRKAETTARLRDEVERAASMREADELVRAWALPVDMPEEQAEQIRETM